MLRLGHTTGRKGVGPTPLHRGQKWKENSDLGSTMLIGARALLESLNPDLDRKFQIP